jgi:phosphoribosylformylglycinamidine synthase
VREGALSGVHDASSGGLGVALAELTCRSGLGLRVDGPITAAQLFSESPSRVVAAVPAAAAEALVARAADAGVAATVIGAAGGDRVVLGELVDLPAEQVISAWRDRLPVALGAGTTQA